MNVLMPQLGETVAEGTVAAWHKKQGDAVKKNEVLLDVETDKAATEVPAPVSRGGRLGPCARGRDGGRGYGIGRHRNGKGRARIGGSFGIFREEGRGENFVQILRQAGIGQALWIRRTAKGAKTAKASKARGRGGKTGRLRLSPVVRRLLAEHGS